MKTRRQLVSTLAVTSLLPEKTGLVIVPRSQSGAVPISSLLSMGSWGSGKLEGAGNWVKGGANRVSLQAT